MITTCKDCIHYNLCRSISRIQLGWRGNSVHYVENVEEICKDFKACAQFVELPCMVGDTLYPIVTGSRIREWIVTDIAFSSYSIVKMVITADSKDKNGTDHIRFGEHYLNHTVFLNREEAERALKEFEP